MDGRQETQHGSQVSQKGTKPNFGGWHQGIQEEAMRPITVREYHNVYCRGSNNWLNARYSLKIITRAWSYSWVGFRPVRRKL